MSELTAQHYLNVWRGRLSMAERGVSSPPPAFIAVMRRLVAAFSKLDQNTEVRGETHGSQMRFIAAPTSELIAKYDFKNVA